MYIFKHYLKLLVILLTLQHGVVMAEQNTVSAGYSSGEINGGERINGMNVKLSYAYEKSRFGVIASMSYLEYTGSDERGFYMKKKIASVSAGPVLQINEWGKIYGLIGFAFGSHSLNQNESNRYGLDFGLGLQLNCIEGVVLDFGYEKSYIGNSHTGSWIIGVGYHF